MSDRKKLPVVGGGSSDPLERLLAGDSAGVIDDLKEKVVEEPDNDVLWLQLGTAYEHIGHWADAAKALSQAVQLDGSMVESRRLYAAALAKLRRYDEAAFQLVQAKRLAPDDARVAHELGLVFYDKRLFGKALRELDRARGLVPSDARIVFSIGLAHEANRDMADAIASYREAVALDPDLIDARRTLADALAAMGEMAAAVDTLTEAQRRDRTNLQIATNLEVLRQGLKDLQAARLIGQTLQELEASALVQQAQLKRKGRTTTAGEPDIVRYGAELVEVWATVDEEGRLLALMLLLTDPNEAAKLDDEVFQVTVLSQDGSHVPANFATAATLTFLREAFGCPLTRAGELYAQLLRTQEPVAFAGLKLSVEAADDERHGIMVAPEGSRSTAG